MATTTNFGFETPDDTDLVKDGALAIRTALNDVDERFGNVATYPNQIVNVVSGVSRPVPFATSCNAVTVAYSASTLATAAVTFPASRFTAAPIVTISSVTSSALSRGSNASAVAISTSGFTANAFYVLNTNQTGNVVLNWHAIQMTSADGGG